MGAIYAKLDSSNAVESLKYEGTRNTLVNIDMDKYKKYLNDFGVIRIKVNTNELNKYIDNKITYYLKNKTTHINNDYISRKNNISYAFSILSQVGFLVLVKKVENFSNTNNINNITRFYEAFGDVTAEPSTNAAQEEQPIKDESNFDSIANILIPQVYFTDKRNEFIDFISSHISSGDSQPYRPDKIVYDSFKKLLDKLNVHLNPQVKIANMIGFLINIAIISFILNNRSGTDYFGTYIALSTDMLKEYIKRTPDDTCIFFDNTQKFLQFTPGMCEDAQTAVTNSILKNCPPTFIEKNTALKKEDSTIVSDLKTRGDEMAKTDENLKTVTDTIEKTEQTLKYYKYGTIVLGIILIIIILMMLFGKKTNTSASVETETD